MESANNDPFKYLSDPEADSASKLQAIDEITAKLNKNAEDVLSHFFLQDSVLAKLSHFWGKQSLRFKISVGFTLIAPLFVLSLLTHIMFLSFLCAQMIILYTIVSLLLEEDFNSYSNKKNKTADVFADLSKMFQSTLRVFTVMIENLREQKQFLQDTTAKLSLTETRFDLTASKLEETTTKLNITELEHGKTLDKLRASEASLSETTESLHLVEAKFKQLMEQFSAMKVTTSAEIEGLTLNNTKLAESLVCANQLVISLNETLRCYNFQSKVQKLSELPELVEKNHQDVKALLEKVFEEIQKLIKQTPPPEEEPPFSSGARFFPEPEKATELSLAPLPGP